MTTFFGFQGMAFLKEGASLSSSSVGEAQPNVLRRLIHLCQQNLSPFEIYDHVAAGGNDESREVEQADYHVVRYMVPRQSPEKKKR